MNANDELIEYLAAIVPGAKVECAGCGREREAIAAIVREGKFYHSVECADRSCAVLDRNRGDVVVVDNWKV